MTLRHHRKDIESKDCLRRCEKAETKKLSEQINEEIRTVRVSVRNLVEFILREGDIDSRRAGGPDRDAMLMGGRLHRKIQRRMGPEYQAEVSLKMRIPCGEFSIQVEGRADGIITGEEVIVDEIKGVLRELSHIEEPVLVHLAQAKCYAYIYAEQQNLDEIGVQMTYCQLDTEEIRRFNFRYSKAELKEWFQELIGQYEKWARFQIEWRQKRDDSIRQVEFPFPYRKGQRDVAAAVYRTILRKKKLFIQAPTGVGKTISTVFPAVKALGERLGEKIFYLTAKTITRTAAEQAFRKLQEQGLCMKVITLTAKEKICFCDEAVCNPDVCPYAKGHFDRVNDAVYDMITRGDEIDRRRIEEQAEKYRVCPFELSLDISDWVDAVICDYNYVFDPTAHLKRFFSEGGSKEYIFLIDEAHNLVERGREMYSAVLCKEDFLDAKKLIKREDAVLARRLDEVNRLFLALKKECESVQILNSVSHIALKLMNLLTEMERYLEEAPDGEKREQILELYFQVRSFISIHDILDENYVIYSEFGEDGRFRVKLFCVNPAKNLQNYLEYGSGTIFFSATLLPIHYYRKLLSVEPDDYAIYAESSFPRENRLLLLGRDVSTRYTMRNTEMYARLARYIAEALRGQAGNYMAFFPSYRMMEDVYEQFLKLSEEMRLEVDTILQSQNMSETEREKFLEMFAQDRGKSLVGFCVMGGIFSEGIDLAEDRLIGAIIVGTGLPQVCNEREIVKQYFEKQDMRGFDYAYLYPGMNKVLQSAGRVIRTEKDKGLILLLDDRFCQRQYREIFPREWDGYRICSADTLEDYMVSFWK
ncbi:ATP-dependent DNA helicase [Clostridium sp. Marseille-P3244]|uniref:ATP-dependent DNA helicase n=1 Tax=Clostridium sp. Marseille-P3244 TaxID=1871020 RepID=UPI0009F9143A